MKKIYLSVAVILTLSSAIMLQSCIGSFALTNKVIKWNKQVGSKFVNELVFFAMWILPVYEVTSIADLFIINSIEFWSGNNPLTASTKIIDTDSGRYLVKCDGKGYTITNETTGVDIRMDFDTESQTWMLNNGDNMLPLLTYIDDMHVKMYNPAGESQIVELSHDGLTAYKASIATQYYTATLTQK